MGLAGGAWGGEAREVGPDGAKGKVGAPDGWSIAVVLAPRQPASVARESANMARNVEPPRLDGMGPVRICTLKFYQCKATQRFAPREGVPKSRILGYSVEEARVSRVCREERSR